MKPRDLEPAQYAWRRRGGGAGDRGDHQASLSKPTVSLVLGGSHSIGGPLAVSADYSFIVPSGTMIIHPVRSNGMFMVFTRVTVIWNGHRTGSPALSPITPGSARNVWKN